MIAENMTANSDSATYYILKADRTSNLFSTHHRKRKCYNLL